MYLTSNSNSYQSQPTDEREFQKAHKLLEFDDYFIDCQYNEHHYPNRDIYKGQWKYGKKWGKGVLYQRGDILWVKILRKSKSLNGMFIKTRLDCTYIGGFKKGELNGLGMLKIRDLVKWCGQFKELPDGQVVRKSFDGELYVGKMLQGLQHGKGMLKHKNGNIYMGEYIASAIWGKGRCSQSDSTSDGYFINGKREGQHIVEEKFGKAIIYYVNDQELRRIAKFKEQPYQTFIGQKGYGTFCVTNGDILQGYFQNGQLEGEGIKIMNNMQKRIEGNFINGVPNGKVKITYTNLLETYEGGFVKDKPCGFAIYKSPTFTCTGDFFEDVIHGYGHYISKNFEYKGGMHMGKYHGKGKINYFSSDPSYYGHSYEGDWVHGKKQGKGTYRTLSGITYNGQWMGDLPNGYGMIYEDIQQIERYTGNFRNSQIFGLGRLKLESLAIYAYFQVKQPYLRKDVRFSFQNHFYTNASIKDETINMKMVGQMTLYTLNGSGTSIIQNILMVGNWVNQLMQNGQVANDPVQVYENGYYINNQIISGIQRTQQVTYLGSFKHEKAHGVGTAITADGHSCTGVFKDGEFYLEI